MNGPITHSITRPRVTRSTPCAEHVDVLIVGAGRSDIGAACHLRRECPDRSFAILEARGATGGTWDQFRYPGIRSDSDMFTLGYSFRPLGDLQVGQSVFGSDCRPTKVVDGSDVDR